MVTTPDRPLVTVVIPVLDDTTALTSLLPTLPVDPSVQVVVVDGGDGHDTACDALRERHPEIEWIRSARGRGVQMNAGAKRARGRWLVFLHADTRLGAGWLDLLRRLDNHPSIVGGSFGFALDSEARWARWIERGVRLREQWSVSGEQSRGTAFVLLFKETPTVRNKNPEVFDLNVEINGGKLAKAFGKEAYLRIVPQAGSTFNGEFTVDFTSERPLTNLRSTRGKLPATVPEPTILITVLTFGAGSAGDSGAAGILRRSSRRRRPTVNPPASRPIACRAPHSRSGGRVRGSGRATRRSP